MKTDAASAKEVLPKVREKLASLGEWNNDSLFAALTGLAAELGVKNGVVLWPARVAVSGRENTPGGATELAELIGKEETLRRLDFAISAL